MFSFILGNPFQRLIMSMRANRSRINDAAQKDRFFASLEDLVASALQPSSVAISIPGNSSYPLRTPARYCCRPATVLTVISNAPSGTFSHDALQDELLVPFSVRSEVQFHGPPATLTNARQKHS